MIYTEPDAGTFRPMDFATTVSQIGRMNLAAISGLRTEGIWNADREVIGVRLPVHAGYRVDVLLAANDTYTVRRTFERGGKRFPKGEMTEVYAEDLGQVAYYASCYVNVDFPLGGHATPQTIPSETDLGAAS